MVLPANILVFDLGTSYFKGTLFDLSGRLLAVSRMPTPFTNTTAPYSEVSVPAFDAALLELADGLRRDSPAAWGEIGAVTFSTQTNSFALLDAGDQPLTPFVVWNDRRAMELEGPLDALMALTGFYETTGVPGLSPEFMAAKLHWFQTKTPELWERVARVALISDYLTLRFTGQFVTEAGAAGLTGLVDIHRLEWWDTALEVAGLERDGLPHIARAGTPIGAITPDAARRFALPNDCQFVVGCLDQYAGAIGAANVTAGGVSETTGTVLATVRCADSFAPCPDSGVFWGPGFAPGQYYQMVFGDVSANLLEAFRNALPDALDFDALGEAATASEPGALTLPRDLDTPELLTHVRGWAQTEPPGRATRAIFEGVARALRGQLDQLCGGARPAEIHSVGGAARSAAWLQIKADTLGVPLRAVHCPEPTSLGAALLAMAALTGAPARNLAVDHVYLAPPVRPIS